MRSPGLGSTVRVAALTVLLLCQLWEEFAERAPEAVRQRMVEDLAERRTTPHQAAERLIALADAHSGRGPRPDRPRRGR